MAKAKGKKQRYDRGWYEFFRKAREDRLKAAFPKDGGEAWIKQQIDRIRGDKQS